METLRLAYCNHGAEVSWSWHILLVPGGFSQVGRGSVSNSDTDVVGFVQWDAAALMLDITYMQTYVQAADGQRGRFKMESDRETW